MTEKPAHVHDYLGTPSHLQATPAPRSFQPRNPPTCTPSPSTPSLEPSHLRHPQRSPSVEPNYASVTPKPSMTYPHPIARCPLATHPCHPPAHTISAATHRSSLSIVSHHPSPPAKHTAMTTPFTCPASEVGRYLQHTRYPPPRYLA